MKALLYLKYRTFINSLKQLKEKPSKFISVLFYLGFLGIAFLNLGNGGESESHVASEQSMHILSLIFFAIVLLITTISWHSGTKNGMRIFQLADTQMLFTAPFKQATILMYGMLGQLQASILSSIFLIYQIPNLKNWGFSAGKIAIIFAIWILLTFFGSILSAFVYAMSFGSERKKIISLIINYAILLSVIIILFLLYLREKSFSGVLEALYATDILYFIPVAGWTKGLLDLFLFGFSWLRVLAGALFFIVPTLFLLILYHIQIDFYEDALSMVQSNLINEDDKKAIADATKKKELSRVKVRKTGIGKGCGESTIFYRRWLEYRRMNRFFVTPLMCFMLIVLGAVAIGTKKAGENLSPIVYWGISIVFVFIGSFESSTIRSLNEYQFYLLPGKALSKVFYSGAFSVLIMIVNVIPAYLFVAVYARFNPLLIPVGILMTLSIILIMNTAQIVVFQIFGEIRSALSMFLLFVITFVFIAPSMVLFILSGISISAFDWLNYLLLLIGILINAGIGYLGLFIGKKYLQRGPEK